MNDELRLAKNKRISDSKKETLLKRESQVCRTFKVKIQESSLTKTQREQLKMIFVEAKWLANDILRTSENNPDAKIWEYATKKKTIVKKDKDFNDIEVSLQFIGSSMKQSVQSEMISNIRALSALKKNGNKVGRLKFKKEVTSVTLKQYGNTHSVVSAKRIRIQGVKGKLVVNGLKQFYGDPNYEVTSAKLLNTPLGYYVSFACYVDKDKVEKKETNGKTIGIDFGCSTAFTTSEGGKITASVRESERLKKLQRKFSRQQKGSKRRYVTLGLIKAEYQKMTNRKNDLANKVVHDFLQYSTVVIQDEQLRNWQKSGHGKAVQRSVLGRVKAKLSLAPNVVVISRSAPTTKLCRECGVYHDEMRVWDRTFVCGCGVSEDRDIHAAKNLVWMYENNLGVERAKVTRMEMEALVNGVIDARDQLSSEKCEGPAFRQD
jgi:putative transposase